VPLFIVRTLLALGSAPALACMLQERGIDALAAILNRAAAARPQFALAANNVSAIAQACRQLDGIPLALELAAACLDALTPDELATRLDQRFRLLTGGNRAALPRQQTLSATMDWSFMSLTETQQRVFERLSVFASGWTLDAAEVVCAGDGVASEDVLDALLQLIRKSLVVRLDDRARSARYGMLETLREYAFEKLQTRGAELSVTRERHATYYSALVQRVDPAAPTAVLSSGEALTAPFIETLDAVHDNVRVALKWWLDARRTTEGLVLIRALGPLWATLGIPPDGRRWVEGVLDLAAPKEMAECAGAPPDRNSDPVPLALRAQALCSAEPLRGCRATLPGREPFMRRALLCGGAWGTRSG
jgi:predicted ATPase